MAPLDQYLMADRNAEIALARSAAPTSISGDATVLVFEKNGYRTAVKGKNGFTCLVERAWMSPFDSPEFWNFKMRGPICYNPAAVRTILPYTMNRTRLALTGLSKADMRENITAAIAKKELPMPEAGAMSYMMSKSGNLGDSVGHWCPHLMFHVVSLVRYLTSSASEATARLDLSHDKSNPVLEKDGKHVFEVLLIQYVRHRDGSLLTRREAAALIHRV